MTASVGLAPNKMTAKIASDLDKPDGLRVVDEKNLLNFLHPLPVEKLWGVGEKTKQELAKIGIRTIGALANRKEEELEGLFGRNGSHAWDLARGIDPREVEASDEIKSIGNEHTFEVDTKNEHEIKDSIMHLSEKVSRRLRKADLKAKTITLKIRFSDFKTYTRAHTLKIETNFVDDIYKNSVGRLEEFDLKAQGVRLVGVKASNFAEAGWASHLFDEDTDESIKKERLHRALDRIIDRFGEGAIGRRDAF